ncbi:hypothetical protein OY671_012797, partial [Metschnikowia pulcherrima]
MQQQGAADGLSPAGSRNRFQRRQEPAVNPSGMVGQFPGRQNDQGQHQAAADASRPALGRRVDAPGSQPGFDMGQALVHDEDDQADEDHGDDHGIEPEHSPPPDEEVSQPFGRSEELDRDQRGPGLGQ